MELSAKDAQSIADINFNHKEDKIQSWVFRKIRRKAKKGNYMYSTERHINNATEERLKELGYIIDENRSRRFIGPHFSIETTIQW